MRIKILAYFTFAINVLSNLSGVEDQLPKKLKDILDNPLEEIDFLPYIQKIQNSIDIKTQWGNQIVFGWMAFRHENFFQSEQQWQKAIEFLLPQELNQNLIKNLCKIYKTLHSKTLYLMYEKYVETYPSAIDTPRVHLSLANFYLNCQAYERALYHFYKILNSALTVDAKNVSSYETYIIWAQLGIAQTYLEQQKYDEAYEFFTKIHLNDFESSIVLEVLFKEAVCAYRANHFNKAETLLKTYCSKEPNTPQFAKAYYYLIHCYKAMEDKENLLNTLFELLKLGQEKRIQQDDYWEKWDKYQTLSAKEIAQDFYTEGKLVDAIKLYQVLVDMRTTPEWQWPILCQMGLCYERLGLSLKSKAAYELIAHTKDQWNEKTIDWSEDLRNYQLQAKWHLEQLETYEKIKLNFEQLVKSS